MLCTTPKLVKGSANDTEHHCEVSTLILLKIKLLEGHNSSV